MDTISSKRTSSSLILPELSLYWSYWPFRFFPSLIGDLEITVEHIWDMSAVDGTEVNDDKNEDEDFGNVGELTGSFFTVGKADKREFWTDEFSLNN